MAAGMSEVEINYVRLMNSCKRLSRHVEKHNFWRFEAFVKHLEKLYLKMETEQKNLIQDDLMIQYRKELMFLKGLVDAEKKATVEEQMKAAQLVSAESDSTHSLVTTLPTETQRQAKKHAQARYNADMRKELLGEEDGLRLRNVGDEMESSSADMDAVLRHHHQVQARLADQFLQLTRSLKQNVTVAGHVVKQDTETVNRIQANAERNYKNLQKESGRLEKHAYRSWFDCGIYCLLLWVILTFICMVLLMRLFPKA